MQEREQFVYQILTHQTSPPPHSQCLKTEEHTQYDLQEDNKSKDPRFKDGSAVVLPSSTSCPIYGMCQGEMFGTAHLRPEYKLLTGKKPQIQHAGTALLQEL